MDWVLPPEPVSNARAPLTASLGYTPNGQPLALDLALLPHLAIAGASGSGKSTLIRTILTSLLTVSTPDDLQLVIVDVTDELEDLRGIPHLAEEPIDDPAVAAAAFEALVVEMDLRYEMLHESGYRNITDYNEKSGKKLPRLLCVVDEFAELMLGDERKRVERSVARLGIRGRKCGVHLILATQIPHANVLTSRIKANMTGRIALAVPSAVFSRVAIDEGGAEKLKGNGDALLRDGSGVGLTRFQGAYVDPEDLLKLVDHWVAQTPADWYRQSLLHPIPVDDGPVHYRLRGAPKLAMVLGCVGALAVFGIPALGGNGGCPSGTTFDPTTLTQTCDNPDGSTHCVEWASGYTPKRSDASDTLQYAPDAPDLGPWCAGASSPPGES